MAVLLRVDGRATKVLNEKECEALTGSRHVVIRIHRADNRIVLDAIVEAVNELGERIGRTAIRAAKQLPDRLLPLNGIRNG